MPGSDWARTLVVLALLILLWRIPFWILRAVRGGGSGRSLIGSIVRTAILIKTAGLIGGRGGGSRASLAGAADAAVPDRHPAPPVRVPAARVPVPARDPAVAVPVGGAAGGDPYAQTRATASGQLMLPLGVRRQPRPPAAPAGRARPGVPHGLRGRQLALPLAEGLWPEQRPVLGPDGQYRLPLDVTRTARPTPATRLPRPAAGPVRARPAAGRQLELPLDPYRGNRPLRSGQYPLPFDGLARHPRPQLPTPTATRRARAPPGLPDPAGRGRRGDGNCGCR